MSSATLSTGGGWFLRTVARPLPLPHFVAAASALILVAAIYCQVYCAIAFQPMQGARMPLAASLAWAASSVGPWLACVELAKRREQWGPAGAQAAGLALLFAGAAATSIVLELGLDVLTGVHATRPLPMQIAAQMPAATIAGLALLLGKYAAAPVAKEMEPIRAPAVDALLADAGAVDWIKAAGNYVEVHAGGRTALHRLTMREVEAALDASRFRRIHRSVIVNLDAVQARVLLSGAPAVRLRDGTMFKVGARYQTSFADA